MGPGPSPWPSREGPVRYNRNCRSKLRLVRAGSAQTDTRAEPRTLKVGCMAEEER